DLPVHIHVAEQVREVEHCVARLGARPIQWLYDHAAVDRRWCLVHATHADENELEAMVSSRAIVGLCPTTEANLGDGLFGAERFIGLGGQFGIGSDSHVSVSPAEELRLLEYGQRLFSRRRAVLARRDGDSVGRTLYESAAMGGARALGIEAGSLAPGARADLVVLDNNAPGLQGRREDGLLDALVFFGGPCAVKEVWVGGRRMVADGIHTQRETVFERYQKAIRALD
ncbi:MAG: amidohydrolase family protein, partial [Gammaproteobacteria bacterium]|nr:amidohydrolase family protein [Gammaproteobacteria bacterium]